MPGIIVSSEFDATPARVWEIVEPVEHHVDWMHDAVAIRFTGEQTRGTGTEFLCDTKVGPFKLVDRMEITEWVPGEVMGVRHIGLVTGSGRFTLTPIDFGRRTRFTWAEDLTFPWWMGGPIGAWVGGKIALGPIWRRNLRNLQRLVEAT
jgi:Polyketide cyclase / dehydrase and lipid transport